MCSSDLEWVVYAKPPFGGAQQAIEYLGRYTHRTAISNRRILNVTGGEVTFQWKDYRGRDKQRSRSMTVSADEFMRRFLMHTLPPGFARIRYFGFLASRHRRQKLALCRRLLMHAVGELLPAAAQCRRLAPTLGERLSSPCPRCGKGVMLRLGLVAAYRWPARPPDTS